MYRYLFLLILSTSLLVSCRNDFDTIPSSGNLKFSNDTIVLDTTFTQIASNTYTLKVYNPSSNDITIPSITLENTNSFYRLLIDGQKGNSITNIDLLANDSLFIMIEATVDFNQLPAIENDFLYTDRILFDAGSLQQDVDIVTLVKDAVFLFPEKDSNGTINTIVLETDKDGNENKSNGFILNDQQLVWTKEKPYVIYGYAVVPPNKTLAIEAGARIHFHDNSGILVSDKATIQANGSLSTTDLLENEIIFEGDKLQELYNDVTGQWGTIWLKPLSVNNSFEHVTIKNATIGIKCEASNSNGLSLKNSKILNNTNYGLLSENGFMKAENCIFNNAGISPISLMGGNYDMNHCTITNYWTTSFRKGKAFELSNEIQGDQAYPITATINNCIIYGNSQFELEIVESKEETGLNYLFNHCLIKFNDQSNNTKYKNNPLYDFMNTKIMNNISLNEDPDFKNPNKNELQIGLNSKAIGIADPFYSQLTPKDITNTDRLTNTAVGAYQSIDFNNISNE